MERVKRELPTRQEVYNEIRDARACGEASRCARMQKAMADLLRLNNMQHIKNGESITYFFVDPEGQCPNFGEPHCQESQESKDITANTLESVDF